MPKVVVNSSKGLVQSSGAGMDFEGNSEGYGMHILTEEVSITPGNANTCGRMTRSIPAGAVITEISAVVSALGTSLGQAYAVHVHSADTAVGAAAAGTELLGAGAAASTIPNGADIEVGTGGTLGDAQLNNTAIDRNAAASFFSVVAGGDHSEDTGTPKLTITVKWIGKASELIS